MVNPRETLQNLLIDDEFYIKKLDLLYYFIRCCDGGTVEIETAIVKEIAPWAKDQGFQVTPIKDSPTECYRCILK